METVESIGHLNIQLGWTFMVFGILIGGLIGMYAFGGPMPVPKSQGDYDNLPRRLTRLGHIAAVALPMMSVLYGMNIDAANLSDSLKSIGSTCMLIGMFGVPTLLFMAAYYLPFKYLEAIPVTCVVIALSIMAYGYW